MQATLHTERQVMSVLEETYAEVYETERRKFGKKMRVHSELKIYENPIGRGLALQWFSTAAHRLDIPEAELALPHEELDYCIGYLLRQIQKTEQRLAA